jgi:hypothetical protein
LITIIKPVPHFGGDTVLGTSTSWSNSMYFFEAEANCIYLCMFCVACYEIRLVLVLPVVVVIRRVCVLGDGVTTVSYEIVYPKLNLPEQLSEKL